MIADKYWCWGLEKEVRRLVKDCAVCHDKSGGGLKAQRVPLKPIPVEPQLFWRVHIDLAGPFRQSRSGNKYLAVGVDAFTKYPEARYLSKGLG